MVLGRYAMAFGSRMIKLLELEIEAARLKREIELIQAATNSGLDWDYGKIQETLDAEFAEWQAKLKAEAENLISQQAVLDQLLDPETYRALRAHFRTLARRLHPDLNPLQSPAEAELWHRVTAAYEFRDLEELNALELLTRETGTVPLPDSIESLRALLEKLRSQLDHLLTTVAKEIFLIATHIAGTSHVPIREIEPTLTTGASLVLRREPHNPHDELAILILTENGEKLGYVPRDRNEILARLMDAGKFLIARLEDKEWHGDWLRVSARVFLRDV